MSILGLLWWLSSKESACNDGEVGLNPGSERSVQEGNGIPLQYYCLGNPKDRGDWWAMVHGAAKESDTTEQLTYCVYPTPTKMIKWNINHQHPLLWCKGKIKNGRTVSREILSTIKMEVGGSQDMELNYEKFLQHKKRKLRIFSEKKKKGE